MKYSDILYYKNKLKQQHDTNSFVYVSLSEEIFNNLVNELNINLFNDEKLFEHKYQFIYDGTYFLLEKNLKKWQF